MKRLGSAGHVVARTPVARGGSGTARLSWVARGLLVCLGAAFVLVTIASPSSSSADEASCVGGAMQIVAHEDDDLFFQSPDLLHDIQAGRCVRTVFVTAGDAAKGEPYWRSRERGSRAAYAQMAGVANDWTTSYAAVAGKSIRVLTLTGAPRISLVFMRLPDGNRRGTGMIVHNHESLMRLWQGSITSIHAVDGSATYTGTSLRQTLSVLMTDFQPTSVRTQDWTIPFGTGDNSDHIAVALFARRAGRDYTSAHTLSAYAGYPGWDRLPNVAGEDLIARQRALRAYATHDPKVCVKSCCRRYPVYVSRLSRQYVTASESTGDSARQPGVKVTASSQNSRTAQSAGKAVDGFALGFPDADNHEWATVGGGADSWIELEFAAPTLINGVVLADRPNLGDQVTGGTLEFSDGSVVLVGPLANNGSPATLSFPARTTTRVRLTITSVSPTTQNVGLAEIETYANMSAGSRPPSAGAGVDRWFYRDP
jgi:LmbE family N-acetylglucosaminyl deacetylase